MELMVNYHWPGAGIGAMLHRLSWLLVCERTEMGQWWWWWIESMERDLENIRDGVKGKAREGSEGHGEASEGVEKVIETVHID